MALPDPTSSQPASSNILVGIESISPFYGNGRAENFLDTIEQTAILGNWTEPQKLAVARLKLRGLAKQYAEADPNLKVTGDWAVFKRELTRRYKQRVIPGQELREFLDCKQRSGENCRDYLIRLQLAANRTVSYTGDEDHDRVLRQKLEEDTVKQFVMGLNYTVRRRVLSEEPITLNAAVAIAEREEVIESMAPKQWRPVRGIANPSENQNQRFSQLTNGNRQFEPPTQQRRRDPPEVSNQRPERFSNRQENPRRNFVPSNIKCFKCNQLGHFARHCKANPTSGTTRCFTCNQPGHFARNCPRKSTQRTLNEEAAPVQPRRAAAEESAEQW